VVKTSTMAKRSYFDPWPSGTLSALLRYWAHKGLHASQMEARLKRLIRIGAIEVTPPLHRGWRLRQSGFEFYIKTPDGFVFASTHRYRIRQDRRSFGPAKAAPDTTADTRTAESSAPTAPKKPGAQFERAERFIKKLFPHGADGITTAAIRKKLAEDKELQAELDERGARGVPSPAVINRVLGRRKT
jgi:hypothetical protein